MIKWKGYDDVNNDISGKKPVKLNITVGILDVLDFRFYRFRIILNDY